jgi:uncharacterized membrane protein YccC
VAVLDKLGLSRGLLMGWLEQSLRTAVATGASLVVARLLYLPEAYWAAVTTLVVMQSTLGAAWAVSTQRFMGTALGAGVGALVGHHLGGGVLVLTVGVFGLGLICCMLRLDQSAYRFAGITFAIVTLVARESGPTVVAAHRFIEVSTGIAVALVITALWPARYDIQTSAKPLARMTADRPPPRN